MVETRLGCGFCCGCGPCYFLHHPTSFNDDLGTMPTRRPCSWKKKCTLCTRKCFHIVGRWHRYTCPSTSLKSVLRAFEACVSLCTVALSRQLRYIGHRAFADCSKLVCFTYRSAKAGRCRPRVAANAFEGCQALTIPGGICYPSERSKQGTQRRTFCEGWGDRRAQLH